MPAFTNDEQYVLRDTIIPKMRETIKSSIQFERIDVKKLLEELIEPEHLGLCDRETTPTMYGDDLSVQLNLGGVRFRFNQKYYRAPNYILTRFKFVDAPEAHRLRDEMTRAQDIAKSVADVTWCLTTIGQRLTFTQLYFLLPGVKVLLEEDAYKFAKKLALGRKVPSNIPALNDDERKQFHDANRCLARYALLKNSVTKAPGYDDQQFSIL